MARYYPSMRKYSWIILVCTIVCFIAGYAVAKAQPTAYQVSSTLLVSAGTPGTNYPGSNASSSDSLSQSMNDTAEIPTRSVMNFVYNFDPAIGQHHFSPDDLLVDVTAMNPSTTTSTILLTATAAKANDAVLLVNDVAKGYQAYKTKQIQDELDIQRQSLQNQYNQYKAQSDSLEQQILHYTNPSDPHVALLTADRNTVNTAMSNIQSQLLQLPPTQNLKSDIFILQPAKLSDATSTSKTTLIVGVTGLIGLAVGLLIWLLMVMLDNRVRTDDQVPEKLGLSYLGGLTTNKEIQAGTVPSGGQVVQQLSDIGVNLRLTGVLPGQWRVPQGAVLLVTSTQAVEGKTTVASGLAAVLARGGRSVLVIDGNLRNPTTHLAFGITPSGFGLSGLLKANGNENIDAAVQRSNIPGVWVLPGGTPLEEATLLMDQCMPAILAQLRKKTDCIIIDGPSLLSGSEASLLASMSDGVAMVVDARYDKVALLLRAKGVLKSLTHTPIGVVMNRVSLRKRNAYYAMAYSEESAKEAIALNQKSIVSGNGNGYENGRPDQTLSPTGSASNFYNTPATPGRPAVVMPMDFPVMQPNPNPPSPFPSPRRMDMTPPQS